jgi:hypothetical protein
MPMSMDPSPYRLPTVGLQQYLSFARCAWNRSGEELPFSWRNTVAELSCSQTVDSRTPKSEMSVREECDFSADSRNVNDVVSLKLHCNTVDEMVARKTCRHVCCWK